MKLYYSPGACSLASHIVLREAALPFEMERVDLGTKKTDAGNDYRETNPKGYVPALRLDNNQVLTEGVAIMQYVADQKPESRLAPPNGAFERVRLQEWLNFIATEVHKGLGALFDSKASPELREQRVTAVSKRLDYLNEHLGAHDFLLGSDFSVADAYLFTVLNWSRWVKLDLAKWPTLMAFSERVSSRPAVHAALEAEGLLH